MCQTVNVSYAVINQSDISDFSPALELTIYGGMYACMCACVCGMVCKQHLSRTQRVVSSNPTCYSHHYPSKTVDKYFHILWYIHPYLVFYHKLFT